MGQSPIQLACDGLYKLNYREVNSNVAVMRYKTIESLENIIINCPCVALHRDVKRWHALPPPPPLCKSRDATPLKRQLMEKYWILCVQTTVVSVLNKE